MAGQILALAAARSLKKAVAPGQSAAMSSALQAQLSRLGNRDIVGIGGNGEPTYGDRWDYPFPPIRFKENTPDILALREKEKGDWKKLSLAEKKTLYRASFCNTFEEMYFETKDWKAGIGAAFFSLGLAILFCCWANVFVYDDHPVTLQEDRKKAQLKRMLDLNMNPVHGLASKWDYENNRWK